MASLAFLIVVGPGMFLLGMVTDWAWYLRAAIVVVAGILVACSIVFGTAFTRSLWKRDSHYTHDS